MNKVVEDLEQSTLVSKLARLYHETVYGTSLANRLSDDLSIVWGQNPKKIEEEQREPITLLEKLDNIISMTVDNNYQVQRQCESLEYHLTNPSSQKSK